MDSQVAERQFLIEQRANRLEAEERAREKVRTNFERGRLWGMSLKQKLAFKHEQLSAGVSPFTLSGAGLPALEIQRPWSDNA